MCILAPFEAIRGGTKGQNHDPHKRIDMLENLVLIVFLESEVNVIIWCYKIQPMNTQQSNFKTFINMVDKSPHLHWCTFPKTWCLSPLYKL